MLKDGDLHTLLDIQGSDNKQRTFIGKTQRDLRTTLDLINQRFGRDVVGRTFKTSERRTLKGSGDAIRFQR